MDRLRFGFEFNVPFTSFERWRHILSPPPEPAAAPHPEPAAPAPPSAVQAPPREGPAPAPVPAKEQVVEIANFAFKPASLAVSPRTVVRWINKDAVVHSSTSDEARWDSGNLAPGQSWSRTFDRPGTYPYHCTPHPFMKGSIVVR